VILGLSVPAFSTIHVAPSLLGIVSLVLLAVAVVALYAFRLAGRWRWIYVSAAVAASGASPAERATSPALTH
jgi:hypothetical protein